MLSNLIMYLKFYVGAPTTFPPHTIIKQITYTRFFYKKTIFLPETQVS